MADFRFRLNPRAGELPNCSAVLNGRGTLYEVNDYRTTLSLKSVVRGAARYHTPQGHYLLTPDAFLILNDGQRYSLEFEGHGRIQTETLCPFFQSGFLERAVACAGARPDPDNLDPAVPALDFCERLYPKTGPVARALAEGIRRRTGASLGIGVTGVAGPSGGTPAKPVGTVHIALAAKGGTTERGLMFSGDRERIRFQASQSALDMVRRHFLGASGPRRAAGEKTGTKV